MLACGCRVKALKTGVGWSGAGGTGAAATSATAIVAGSAHCCGRRRGRRGFGWWGGASVVPRYCTTTPPPSASPSRPITPKRSQGASWPSPRMTMVDVVMGAGTTIGFAAWAEVMAVGVAGGAVPVVTSGAMGSVPVAVAPGTASAACPIAQPVSTTPAIKVRHCPRVTLYPTLVAVHHISPLRRVYSVHPTLHPLRSRAPYRVAAPRVGVRRARRLAQRHRGR